MEIVSLHKQLTGESADRLRELFVLTDLINSSTSKLKEKSWHKKAEALIELTEMQIETQLLEMMKYLDSKNKRLRELSQLGVLRIQGPAAIEEILVTNELISPLQQIEIMEVVSTFDPDKISKLHKFMVSRNNSVLELNIKLAVRFFQFDCILKFNGMLRSINTSVQWHYIWAVGELHLPEQIPSMVEEFENFNLRNKLESLAVIGQLAPKDYVEFFKKHTFDSNEEVVAKCLMILNDIISAEEFNLIFEAHHPESTIHLLGKHLIHQN
jgi:hypothetical protein